MGQTNEGKGRKASKQTQESSSRTGECVAINSPTQRRQFRPSPQKQEKSSYVPEYKRLGITPVDAFAKTEQNKKDFKDGKKVSQAQKGETARVSSFKPYQPVIPIQAQVQDPEADQESLIDEINQEPILLESIDNDHLNKIPDFGYILYYNGEFILSVDTKAEIEEYLETEMFKDGTECDPDLVNVFKKIPVKIGVSLLE
jgi:hypothetical protein